MDSFITYKNVIFDFEKARKNGIKQYQEELNKKIRILEFLIKNYNDGKRKNFYCLAVNLINLSDFKRIMESIDKEIIKLDLDKREKIKLVIELTESIAKKENIELKLRKQ